MAILATPVRKGNIYQFSVCFFPSKVDSIVSYTHLQTFNTTFVSFGIKTSPDLFLSIKFVADINFRISELMI